jgi:heat shock protein HspQ
MKKQIRVVVEDIGPYFFDHPVDVVMEKLKPYSGMSIEVNPGYYDQDVDILIVETREETDEEYNSRLAKEREKEEDGLRIAQEKRIKAEKKEKELLTKLKAKYE